MDYISIISLNKYWYFGMRTYKETGAYTQFRGVLHCCFFFFFKLYLN